MICYIFNYSAYKDNEEEDTANKEEEEEGKKMEGDKQSLPTTELSHLCISETGEETFRQFGETETFRQVGLLKLTQFTSFCFIICFLPF